MADRGQYDPELTLEHAYLGDDLEELRGRSQQLFSNDGKIHRILVLGRRGVTLIPGETLPLLLHNSSEIALFSDLIRNKHVFGVLYLGQDRFGTIAEIRSFRTDWRDNGEVWSLMLKAVGCQRFEVVKNQLAADVFHADVRILPDLRLQCPQQRIFLERERNNRFSPVSLISRVTPWPSFTFSQLDENLLLRDVKQNIETLVGTVPSGQDPIAFSFWVTANLPANDAERLLLLRADSAQERLRLAKSFLNLDCIIVCRDCNETISNKSKIFSMSKSGAQGTFVNMTGYVHEMVTVNYVTGVRHYGHSSQ